jgi:hypothetical protein
MHHHPCWYARDEAQQRAAALGTDANVPVTGTARRLQSPSKKLGRVVKTKRCIGCLDVVVPQQRMQLGELLASQHSTKDWV